MPSVAFAHVTSCWSNAFLETEFNVMLRWLNTQHTCVDSTLTVLSIGRLGHGQGFRSFLLGIRVFASSLTAMTTASIGIQGTQCFHRRNTVVLFGLVWMQQPALPMARESSWCCPNPLSVRIQVGPLKSLHTPWTNWQRWQTSVAWRSSAKLTTQVARWKIILWHGFVDFSQEHPAYGGWSSDFYNLGTPTRTWMLGSVYWAMSLNRTSTSRHQRTSKGCCRIFWQTWRNGPMSFTGEMSCWSMQFGTGVLTCYSEKFVIALPLTFFVWAGAPIDDTITSLNENNAG